MDIEKLKDQVRPYIDKPYRFYHNMEHVEDIISNVQASCHSQFDVELGILFAVYHDVIYEPRLTDNEEKSIELMKKIIPKEYKHYTAMLEVLITYSKYQWDNYQSLPKWVWNILKFDVIGLIKEDEDIVKNEMKIFKEYQFVDFDLYKEARIEILKKFASKLPHPNNIASRIEFLKSFDPNKYV